MEKLKTKTVFCGCGKECRLTKGQEIYGGTDRQVSSYISQCNYWLCDSCGAYVGCHGDSGIPLGTPADLETRYARKQAYEYFDWIWKIRGKYNRSQLYRWLADKMELTSEQCHIGLFSATQCRIAIELVKEHRKELCEYTVGEEV